MRTRRLNWKNIAHGICLLAIMTVVMVLMSVDWGAMI